MSRPITKKEVAGLAGVSVRTINRNSDQWTWLEKCKAQITRRVRYNQDRVIRGLRQRGA